MNNIKAATIKLTTIPPEPELVYIGPYAYRMILQENELPNMVYKLEPYYAK